MPSSITAVVTAAPPEMLRRGWGFPVFCQALGGDMVINIFKRDPSVQESKKVVFQYGAGRKRGAAGAWERVPSFGRLLQNQYLLKGQEVGNFRGETRRVELVSCYLGGIGFGEVRLWNGEKVFEEKAKRELSSFPTAVLMKALPRGGMPFNKQTLHCKPCNFGPRWRVSVAVSGGKKFWVHF